jgi:hypothetical protein
MVMMRDERKAAGEDTRVEIERQVKLATVQIEAKAAMELDAVLADREKGKEKEKTTSTPLRKRVRLANAETPVRSAAQVLEDVSSDSEKEDEEEEEETFSKDGKDPGAGAAAAAATTSAKTLGKRDPRPPPASFYLERTPAPEELMPIAGSELKFGGKGN